MTSFFKRAKESPQGVKEAVKQLERVSRDLEYMNKRVLALENKTERIKKISLVRYDAFSRAGGKQSFSIAMLDEDGNGAVLTGLYSDDKSRVFAKPVRAGKSEYSLSDEEKEAIKKAKGF